MKASKIASQIEKIAPRNLAESWDNVGFQIGSKSRDVKRILTSLDITPETVKEAIENNVDMIVSHHPYFFRKIGMIDFDTTRGKMTEDLIKNDIAVYSAHTNLDKAEKGLNQYIAERLDLTDIKVLSPDTINHRPYKLVIYVPVEDASSIYEVIEKEGIGTASDLYDNCTFTVQGESTFRPLEGSDPYIGETGKTEHVEEVKIETIVDSSKLSSVLDKIKRVHPYEEMAYDLFPIEIREYPKLDGLGRIGKLKEKMSPDEFIDYLKDKLEVTHLREAGRRPEFVKKVALCTGAGSEFIRAAKNKGADVYITGDLKYHEAQTAYELKMWTVDAGHFGTEKDVAKLLASILSELGDEVEIIVSEESQDFIRDI